eukprot:2990867-Prymnesium_polylepis.1
MPTEALAALAQWSRVASAACWCARSSRSCTLAARPPQPRSSVTTPSKMQRLSTCLHSSCVTATFVSSLHFVQAR